MARTSNDALALANKKIEQKEQEIKKLKEQLRAEQTAKNVLRTLAPCMAVLARSEFVAPEIRQELMMAELDFLTLPDGYLE